MIYGLGLDLCQIERMANLSARFGRRLANRILTDEEQANIAISPRQLAKHFAVKEAVSKCLGVGIGRQLSFQDITLRHTPAGQPYVVLSEQVAPTLRQPRLHITITDDAGMMAAMAVAEKVEQQL